MNKTIDKDTLIRMISEKSRFNLGDSRLMLDALIDVLGGIIWNEDELNVRGFGKLYVQNLPPRKGSKLVSDGKELPAAKRVIFRLSKDLRNLVK